MAGNSVEDHSAPNLENHSDTPTPVNSSNIPHRAFANLHHSLFSFNSKANQFGERVTNPVRQFIRPYHQTGSAYRWYGIADAINLSFSLFSLGYFFKHAYQQSSQLLSPKEFQLTVKEFHDAEKTPEGLALVVVFTVFLVGFSTLGSFYDEKKDAPWVKYLMFLWPYIRDAGKQFKWTDKGAWAGLSLLVQYNVVNQDFLVQNMFFMAWTGGLFSAANRIWLRWMRDQRKEMVKTNLDLIEGIKSPLHQMDKMPESLQGYECSLVFLQETKESQKVKTLFYIDDAAQPNAIEMAEKDWAEFCQALTDLQTENIHARMKQYLTHIIKMKSEPCVPESSPPSPLHFTDDLEKFRQKDGKALAEYFDSYVYQSLPEGIDDHQRLVYIDNGGTFIPQIEENNSKRFHEKYREVQQDKSVLNLSTLQVKSILDSKINGAGKQLLDDNYVKFVNLRRDILATDSDWIQGYGYDLALMTELPETNLEQAQKGKIYLSEQGNEYLVRDPNGELQLGRLHDIDLTQVATRLGDPTLKTAILQATSKVGHTQRTSLIKKQSDLVAWFAPLSAGASAIGDGLYFYIFVAKITMATLSPPMAILMLGTSVALFMVCMVTRIAEEFDFQRRLQVTVLRTEAELSKKDCGFLHEKLEKLMNKIDKDSSIDLDSITTESRISMENRKKQSEPQKLEKLMDDNDKANSIDLNAITTELKSSMKDRKKQLERHGIVATTPEIDTDTQQRQTTMLLWNELYDELQLSKALQDKLRVKLDRSYWAAALEGLQNGLALQGAIASFSFMVSTLCYVFAATCPPAFIVGCLAVGIGLIIIACLQGMISHYFYLEKVKQTKHEMSLEFHLEMLDKMTSMEKDYHADYVNLKQACNYVSLQPLDPPVDFVLMEWSEIFRLLFKGAVKGHNASIEILGGFLQDSDNMWALPYVIVAGMASFAWALGVRATAKGFAVGRPDNSLNSGTSETKARTFFDGKRRSEPPIRDTTVEEDPDDKNSSSVEEEGLEQSDDLYEREEEGLEQSDDLYERPASYTLLSV